MSDISIQSTGLLDLPHDVIKIIGLSNLRVYNRLIRINKEMKNLFQPHKQAMMNRFKIQHSEIINWLFKVSHSSIVWWDSKDGHVEIEYGNGEWLLWRYGGWAGHDVTDKEIKEYLIMTLKQKRDSHIKITEGSL